jgi:HK97 family phage major capsid protein
MDLKDMNLQQVDERIAALDEEVRNATTVADVETRTNEKKSLLERKAELQDLEQRKKTALDLTAGVKQPDRIIETRKDEKPMTEHIGNMSLQQAVATPEYRTAWAKSMMAQPMNDVEKRVWDLVTLQSAAPAVPVIIAEQIVDRMAKIAPMINEITLFRVPGVLRIMVEGARAAAALHQENAPIVPAADTLVPVVLSQFEFAKAHQISATIRSTAIPAFEAWLVNALAEDLALLVENAIVNGTNVTGGIENVINPWVNNVSGIDYGAGLTYDNIVDLMALLPARHDRNAKWLMNKAMFYNQFAKVQDANGFPIVAKEFSAAIPFRVLGSPVIISDTIGAGVAYYGNFRQMYGNMSQDITVKASEEAGFLTNSVIYRGTVTFDCDHPDNTAWVKMFT